MEILQTSLQIIIALGIFNVWFLRFSKATNYRGGKAANLREEFATYGLPGWSVWVIGTLKVGCAMALIAGLWFDMLVQPAAGLLAMLMVGAIVAHVKVKDPLPKALPAIAMLLMCLAVVFLG